MSTDVSFSLDPFSNLFASHGVIANATNIEVNMVRGTLIAIGRMYGPIMPVIKNMGINEAITARVARIIGPKTSLMAVETDSRRGSRRIDR